MSIAGDAIGFSREHFHGERYGDFVGHAVGITRHKVADYHDEERRYRRIPIKPLGAEESIEDFAIPVGDSPDDIAAAREALSRLSPEEVSG